MHRVHVAEHQDAGRVSQRVWKARAHAVAESHATRDGFDPRAEDREVARRDAHHAVDRGGIEGRALAFDPRPQAGQHCLGVEGKLVRPHGNSLSASCRIGHSMSGRARHAVERAKAPDQLFDDREVVARRASREIFGGQ
jgi:hypothetical protein